MEPTEPTVSTRVRTGQRRYTDQDAADTLATLAECDGNVAACSRTTGVPTQTIRDWRDGRSYVPSPEVVAERKRQRAERWESITDCAQEVVLDKLELASAAQAAIIAGIATEKGLLLRGEATVIHSTADAERAALFAAHFSSAFQDSPQTSQDGPSLPSDPPINPFPQLTGPDAT